MRPEESHNSMNNHDCEAGRTLVQRNTFYEFLADGQPLQAATNEAEPPSGKSKVLEDNLATA